MDLSKRSAMRPIVRVWLAMAIYTALFSFLCIQRWRTAYLGDPDYGLFNQSFWTTTHDGMLFFNTYEGGTHFRNHNSPVFFLILPLYALLPRMETLLVVQTAGVALSALAVFRLGQIFLEDGSASTLAIAWLCYHPLHGVSYDQFNELAFLPAPLLFSMVFLYQRKMAPFWGCIVIALGCKEDVPFVTFMLGVYITGLGWRARREGTDRRLMAHGIALMVVSIAWLLLTLLVFFPYVRGGGEWNYFRERYGDFGNSLGEVARNLALHPWRVVPYVFGRDSLLVFAELVIPLALLPLRQPQLLMLAAPSWLILQLSKFGAMHNAGSRYMAPVLVIMVTAAIVALRQQVAPVDLARAPLPPLPEEAWQRTRSRARLVLWLTALFALAIGQTPVRFPFKRVPLLTLHQLARNALVEKIPPEASVSTQPEFYGKVSNRANAWIGYHEGSDYILVDPTPDYTHQRTWYDHAHWDTSLPPLVAGGQYVLVEDADGALLYRRRDLSAP